ncbi:MAG: polyribonucleotide nucleotidyltransferase [Maribacter sp.]
MHRYIKKDKEAHRPSSPLIKNSYRNIKMGKQIPISVSFDLPDGTPVTIETGKLATLAAGSVVVRVGDTMIFAAVSSSEARKGQSFFPLSVDYQEKFASAGRIPGNFFRREARLSEHEILTSRLVDRAVRPLFPKGYMKDTQIIINLMSAEPEVPPEAYAALAASAALCVSNLPFDGPISEVRVARIKGNFIVNPMKSDLALADMDIIVAATMDNVMMVEGEMSECQEADLLEAIKIGHDAIKVQCEAQVRLKELVGADAVIIPYVGEEVDEELSAKVLAFAKDGIYAVAKGAHNKKKRKEGLAAVKDSLKAHLEETEEEGFLSENWGKVKEYLYGHQKTIIREMVLSEGVRLDGRKTDQVRPIWTEVDYLPSTHGSAIFNRGETQALATMTLGSKKDNLMVDTAQELSFSNFILHYNFPGFSVGEAKPNRGPGRREIGHANLAARSIKKIMPDEFPYTVRILSDVLESNGSSSMATVCAGSLALMDAGVPVKAAVSGVAMGMIADGERIAILTDILGDEDALGDMDFKVTGTYEGITACQMDIKVDGLPYEILAKALEQAKAGRVHILNEMAKTLDSTREDFKPHAPRIVELKIDKSFIGAVIGPGGRIIQELQATTGTTINIEEVDDHGVVQISSNDKASIDAALAAINAITFMPAVGDIYDSVVATIQPYGAFVDFKGGKSGLLHVSEIAYERVEKVEDFLKEGDAVQVKVIGIDEKTGKIKLSRKALLEKPEGWVERPPRSRDSRGSGDRRPSERRGSGDRRPNERRGSDDRRNRRD